MWWMGMFDTADQAGALGYHDLTTAGLPIGKVFAKTTLDAHDLVFVTLSHEVLEILGDPDINLIVQKGGRGYSYEVCDAVEDDSLGYDINGVLPRPPGWCRRPRPTDPRLVPARS